MAGIDIYDCIIILKEKSKWFFGDQKNPSKLECLTFIQNFGTPGVINEIFEFLQNDDALIRNKTAETILHLFKKLTSLNEYSGSLKHLRIIKGDISFYRRQFDENTYVQLLGIASFNSSGYIREYAINELSRLKNPGGLKFIILRLGDWVAEVRTVATEAMFSFLQYQYIDILIKHLPEIQSLLKVRRVNLQEVYNRVVDFLVQPDFSAQFYSNLNRFNDKARFYFYKILLQRKKANEEVLAIISTDRNFLIRLEVLNHFNGIDMAYQKKLIGHFMGDKSARIRREALYKSKQFGADFEKQTEILLSDEAASVRELSRHLLKDTVKDFASLYKERIAGQELLPGSIMGLSETGTKEDLPTFQHYITSKNNKLILASLTAINKFNDAQAKQISLTLVTHPDKKIRAKAADIIVKNQDTVTLELLRNMYPGSSTEAKKTMLKLFSKVGGLAIAGDLLLALADENTGIQNLGWQLLNKWKTKAISYFITPSKNDIERANTIYQMVKNSVTLTPPQERFLEHLKFFLN